LHSIMILFENGSLERPPLIWSKEDYETGKN
jgi:hypothetical protein